MLIVLFIFVLMIGVTLMIFGNWCDDLRYSNKDKNKLFRFLCGKHECFYNLGLLVFICGIIATICAVACLPIFYFGTNAKVEQYKERYNALIYKVESGACRDDFGLLSKEVIDEIQVWNENIVYGKRMQHDFWLGPFWPDIYDQFETIDYTNYKKGD